MNLYDIFIIISITICTFMLIAMAVMIYRDYNGK